MSSTTDQYCEQPFKINKFEWKIDSGEFQNSTLFLSYPVLPFNKQIPTEQDVQVIEENRRRLGPLSNARDENATKLEEKASEESKKSIGRVNNVGEGSEKPTVEIGMSNLDTVGNKNLIEASISGRRDASLNCDSKLTKPETRVEDYVCGLDVSAKFSSHNPTPEVYTTDNFEVSLSKSQSRDLNKCTSPIGSLDLGNSTHSCLETSCNELAMTDEPSENSNVASTGTMTEGCSRCDLLKSMWNSSYKESRNKFIEVLGNAVRKRVWNLPRTNSDSVAPEVSSGTSTSEGNSFTSLSGVPHKDARVGILFSGGIDSMMIAALADK